MADFPILSAIAYLPLLGALVIFFIPHVSRETARLVALVTTAVSFVLSLIMLVAFNPDAPFGMTADGPDVSFKEHFEWLPGVGASYLMGVDGIAVLLIVLTTLLSVIAIVWSWATVNRRTRAYYIALLLLETGMFWVFIALDLFLFYIF